jgi:hypothetical protein
MGKQIPRSLGFVKPTLKEGEADRWLRWYNNLAMPDRRNVGTILRNSYAWMQGTLEYVRPARENWSRKITEKKANFNEDAFRGDYFITAAVGSTLKGHRYNDVDLMFVTSTDWRDMNELERTLLSDLLSDDFSHTIDKPALDRYTSFLKGKRAGLLPAPDTSPKAPRWPNSQRTLITLAPKQGSGKSIHLIIQPEIPNERHWVAHDPDPSVVLYRLGDVSGYR